MPAAVRLDDPAVRVGPLEFGVDLDRLRGGGRGGEKRERNEADRADEPYPTRVTPPSQSAA
jgi:hypothetical protein